jgi:hypothetical protein
MVLIASMAAFESAYAVNSTRRASGCSFIASCRNSVPVIPGIR